MAITNITIIQDNILNDVPLLTINNPLAFIAEVEYSVEKPDRLEVIMDVNGETDTFNAIPYKDTSNTTRQFIFFANEYIKSLLPPNFDTLITSGTFTEIVPVSITIGFAGDGILRTVTFDAIDGTRQFSDANGASAADIFNNEYNYFYSTSGGFCYLYFYAKDTGGAEVTVGTETFAIDQITEGKFYRLKLATDWEGERNFSVTRTLTMNPEAPTTNTFLTGTINSLNVCGVKVLKFYDRNGQYRFMPCYFGEKRNSFKSDGIVSKYVTSLSSGDGDRYIKGKSNEEELTLNIINFPRVHVWMIEDLFASPYVYIHNNEDLLYDELTDWLYAEIAANSINVRRTGNVINSRFTVKMPKKYTITT